MTTKQQKQILLDNIFNLAYIHHGAKRHNNKKGADRWQARLYEASAIATMLELATEEEIAIIIRSAEIEFETEAG